MRVVPWLLLLGAVAAGTHVGRLEAQGPPGDEPLLVKAVAEDRHVFLQWNPTPGVYRYLVRWRPAGDSEWREVDAGHRPRAVVTGLDNGVRYEFQVVARRAAGGLLTSITVRQQPRSRGTCGAGLSTFCSQEQMAAWMDSASVTPDELVCRQRAVTDWGLAAPDCLYETPLGTVLLLRASDSVFTPPEVLSPPATIRAVARRMLWPLGDPFTRPGAFPADVVQQAFADTGKVRGFASVSSYVVATKARTPSNLTVFKPRVPAPGRLALYLEGHSELETRATVTGAETITWLLARGWTVGVLDMPIMGSNAERRAFGLTTHNDFDWLDDGITSPLGQFFLPVKAAIDWLIPRSGSARPDLLLVGRSGGGWTAYVYGALDERVDAVASAAGGLPLSLRLRDSTRNIGDYEQIAPHFYGVVSHFDLMTAAGRRGAFYAYATFDPCCFRVRSGEPFVRALERAGPPLNKLIVTVVDPFFQGHGYGPAAYRSLDAFLNQVFGPPSRPRSRPMPATSP